jgi:methionyl-tRNA formyltransferase
MRLVFAGTPNVACTALDALVGSRHRVVGVITRPDAARGRGRTLTMSPVAQRATELDIPVLRPTSLSDPSVEDDLGALTPDCCPIVAYGGLVPQRLLELPPHGWVNLHFSLLPLWRGAAPVQHAVLHGDAVTGASTFRLTAGLDTGPVYGTVTESVAPSDTSGELLSRLATAGAELLLRTLDGIEDGQLLPIEQPGEGVSFAPKLSARDARVRWSEPALAVDRRIRACTPDPGAWTEYAGDRLGLLPIVAPSGAGQLPDLGDLAPGVVQVTKRAVFVGTGSFPVQLGQVRPAGKKTMDSADWARGVRLADGARLQ